MDAALIVAEPASGAVAGGSPGYEFTRLESRLPVIEVGGRVAEDPPGPVCSM